MQWTRRWFSSILHSSLALATVLLAIGSAATAAEAQGVAGGATFHGTVRDAANRPIADAEVIVRDTDKQLVRRTDSQGEFTLADIPPGPYIVWFRASGFHSVVHNWAARYNGKSDTTVRLLAIAPPLKPATVRAREDSLMRDRGSIVGVVADEDRVPLAEVEIELVGADMAGTTTAKGGFIFGPLPMGAYVMRVRKLGYEPTIYASVLHFAGSRDVVITMKKLRSKGSADDIAAASGYGPATPGFRALEQRVRWQGPGRGGLVGPYEIVFYHGHYLLDVQKVVGDGLWEFNNRLKINPVDARMPIGLQPGSLCLMMNDEQQQAGRPLNVFPSEEVGLLEVFPNGVEVSADIARAMKGSCAAKSATDHPTYFIFWQRINIAPR